MKYVSFNFYLQLYMMEQVQKKKKGKWKSNDDIDGKHVTVLKYSPHISQSISR